MKDDSSLSRREFFNLVVAVFKAFRVDSAGKYHRYLSSTAESIFVDKETIITALEGSFLDNGVENLLVRPLRAVGEGQAYEGKRVKGLLIKQLRFLGGMNVLR